MSIIEQFNRDAEAIYEQVRRYMPELAKRLGMTYLLPVLFGLLVGTVILLIAPRFLPESTASVLAFAANLLIMTSGWKWLEARTQSTPLFIAYTRVSKARRGFNRILDDETQMRSDLEAQLQQFEDTAVAFIAQMKQAGAKPVQKQAQ